MRTPEINGYIATGLATLSLASAGKLVEATPQAFGQEPIPADHAHDCDNSPGTQPGWVTNSQGEQVVDCVPSDPNAVPDGNAPVGTVPPEGTGGISSLSFYYSNPLRYIHGLRPKRIDMGVDYKGQGPVKAIGEGIVTRVERGTSRFWGRELGNVVVYRLTEGPAKNKSVFVAENCAPKVHKFQRVHDYTTVCYMRNQAPNIETGWAIGHGSDKPVASKYYHEGQRTAHGDNFNQFMVKLGAPSGTISGRHIVGYLDSSYHTW